MTPRNGRTSAQPPRRTDARLNRERLIATARDVFAEAGPGASLNEIARRAGVGPGTLYRHFPHRSALLTAVLRDRIETLCEQAEHLLTADSADEALARWTRAFLAHARANHAMGSALMVDAPDAPGEADAPDAPDEADALGLDCHRLVLDAATGLLTRAQQRGTARADLAADDLIRLVVGIALTTAHQDDRERSERLLTLVLDAVHGQPHRSA